MSRPAARLGPAVRQAIAAVDRGDAALLDGRGVNQSYRLHAGGRDFSVKVHCGPESGPTRLARLTHLDSRLRGAAWYPAITDAAIDDRGRLVVVRPYAAGLPLNLKTPAAGRAAVVRILAALDAVSCGSVLPAELVEDYADAWLESRGGEYRSGAGEAWPVVDRYADDLVRSARRLSESAGVAAYHGDLHGGNLLAVAPGRVTVIDWDQAGYSRRPADLAKAMWLCCRRERGRFELDARAVRDLLRRLGPRRWPGNADAADLARLGAIWFIPTARHVRLLGQRRPDLVDWYVDWIGGFWRRFGPNLDLVARVAADGPSTRDASPEVGGEPRDIPGFADHAPQQGQIGDLAEELRDGRGHSGSAG